VLKGRCACRAVTYEVADEFVVAYNCHCSNCRAMTGSAFLPWVEIEPEKLRVIEGENSLMLTGDLHGHYARHCGECFSLVYWTGYDGKIRVPYGSLVDEPSLKPMATGSSPRRHRGTRFVTTCPSTTSTPGLSCNARLSGLG
jgi:hypothetical protein